MKQHMEKNNKFLKIILTALLSAMVFMLSGCGDSVKKEDELAADLVADPSFYAIEPVEITNFEITKRQTNEAEKTDIVYVAVNVENDAVQCEMHYKMVYGLYDEGWILDEVIDDAEELWSFTPLKGVEEDVITSYLPENAEITSEELLLDSGTHEITYTYTDSHKYCDIVRDETLLFSFDKFYSGGVWTHMNTIENNTYEIWDIDGEWETTVDIFSNINTVTLTIEGFNPKGIAYDNDPENDNFYTNGSYRHTRSNRGSKTPDIIRDYSDPMKTQCQTKSSNPEEKYYFMRVGGDMIFIYPDSVSSFGFGELTRK